MKGANRIMYDKKLLSERLASLSDAEYEKMFGKEDTDPLCAFSILAGYHQVTRRRRVTAAVKAESLIRNCYDRRESLPVRKAYIHIPFCKGRCLYCNFFANYHREEKVKAYLDCLITELQRDAVTNFVKSHPFCAVYIGGGTPSDLPPAELQRLLKAVRDYVPLANDVEITMEGRLSGLDDKTLETAFKGGVNRLSIGVQSFNSEVRRQMGRKLKREEVMERLSQIARLGQAPVIADLIYGLPDQDMTIWEQDVQDLLDLNIDGASVYLLRTYRNNPLEKAIRGEMIPPGAPLRMQGEMYLLAREMFVAAGYRRLNMTHWARYSRERCIYDSQAKADTDLAAYGCQAHGEINGTGMINHVKVLPYQRKVARGLKPLMFCAQAPEDYRIYYEICDQMGSGEISFDRIEKKYGVQLEGLVGHFLGRWSDMGFMVRDGKRFTLTPVGEFCFPTLTQTILHCLDLASHDYEPRPSKHP